MVDIWLAVAILLMIAAVAGSVLPIVPGGLLPIAGILVYWWSTGYSQPSNLFLAGFITTALFAVAFDYLSGIVAAKIGGASNRNSILGGIVGFVLFFAGLGPIGLVIGVAATVFLLEMRRTNDRKQSFKAGVYSAIGVLGSTAVQLVITITLLIAFVIHLVL